NHEDGDDGGDDHEGGKRGKRKESELPPVPRWGRGRGGLRRRRPPKSARPDDRLPAGDGVGRLAGPGAQSESSRNPSAEWRRLCSKAERLWVTSSSPSQTAPHDTANWVLSTPSGSAPVHWKRTMLSGVFRA